MLQDSNKGKAPKINQPDIQNIAIQSAETIGGQLVSEADAKVQETVGKVQKVAGQVSEVSNYFETSQQSIDSLFPNSTIQSTDYQPSEGFVAEPTKQSNAAVVAASQLFGVNHLIALTIFIDGGSEIKSYKHFSLSQSAVGHHAFTLVLDHDALGGAENHEMEKSQGLLGKKIIITFSYRNILEGKGPERDFVGVITSVGFAREYGNRGNIVLKGNSPTVLLDGASHFQSFGGKEVVPVFSIAESILQEGLNGKYEFKVDPKYTGNLSYSCQYEETHYNYLARLASSLGEQFYYDGEKILFGKLPEKEAPIELTFGKDCSEIDIQMRIRHVKRELYGYNSNENKPLTASATKIDHQSSLAKAAYSASEKTFTTPSLQVASLKAVSDNDVSAAQESAIGHEAVNVFVTSGKTTVPFLYPGCVVKMSMRKPTGPEVDYMTELMITAVSHSVDALGHYEGYFEAVDVATGYLPAPVFHTPIAQPQVAIVMDNSDSQGRVQVQFDWQDGGKTTEWIRVATIDAGNSGAVTKNRGLVFIPEKDDQVMVGFVHNHPDRPYVMHAMFTGETGSGGGDGNNTKSIITKSNVSITFDDSKGSLTIKDKGEEVITLDGAGNITVNAASSISLSTGSSNITMKSDGTIDITGVNITVSGDKISEEASTEYKAQSGGATAYLVADGNKATLSGTEATVSGSDKATVSGNTTATLTSVGTSIIDGGVIKLN